MTERRKFARLDTRLPIAYRTLASDTPVEAASRNIGAGGICLFVKEPLQPGTRLEVTLTLPDRERPITVAVEVTWCQQYELIGRASGGRLIEAGVSFLSIDPQDREAIMRHCILSFSPPTTP